MTHIKKLVVITDTMTIVEHLNASQVEARLNYIRSKHKVITHEIKAIIKHVEVKSQPEITATQYAKVA